MAKIYKVWVDIEEYDTETDEGTMREDLNLDIGSAAASFDNEAEALAFARDLKAQGDGIRAAGDEF